MYERFTERARTVMQLADEEALHFHQEYLATEHILAALAKEGAGLAAHVLNYLGVDHAKIRLEIEKVVPPKPDMASFGKLILTPRSENVIEYAREEARKLNHMYVGTEHLLLGLVREKEGFAVELLRKMGIVLEEVRREVLNALGHGD